MSLELDTIGVEKYEKDMDPYTEAEELLYMYYYMSDLSEKKNILKLLKNHLDEEMKRVEGVKE